MELASLFSEQKWNILCSLSVEKYSPLQLANKLNTSIANISQQLRLLEAANLVKTEKIPSRDKGKPRKLFSLTHDTAYLIPTMQDFAHKKLLKLSDHQKIILKIWFLENPKIHYMIEKIYWAIDSKMDEITMIAVNQKESPELILASSKPKDIEKKIAPYKKEIKITIFKDEDARKLVNHKKGAFAEIQEIYSIYDPEKLLVK